MRITHAPTTRTLFLAILTIGAAGAQLTTSSLVGTVTDPSGLGVPGVAIRAVHVDTGHSRETTPDSHGDFVFSRLEPGAYNVSLSMTGFKTKQLQDVILITGETRPLGRVQLDLGNVSETVEVTAQGAGVMTRSSERAAEITSAEVEDLEVRGRNFMGLLELLPGVVSLALTRRSMWPGIAIPQTALQSTARRRTTWATASR